MSKNSKDGSVWIKTKIKTDFRPARGLFAPGSYLNSCMDCGDVFVGDKRSIRCADCAYGEKDSKTLMI